MQERVGEEEMVTPGEVLGKGTEVKAGRGAYLSRDTNTVYASLTGRRSLVPPSPESSDQRPTVEVIGHKAHGPVPEPGCVVIARVTKVMARMASADIMCVGAKSVREKFSGVIRQQDVRATEIDKVDMHSSFRPGDIVKASVVEMLTHLLEWVDLGGVLSQHSRIKKIKKMDKKKCLQISLGDARAYYLSTAQNELGVVSAESMAGNTMVPISWTEMQCPLTGQIEPRKVAKVGA